MSETIEPQSGQLQSGQLVRYDAMCQAIAAAYKVDEVKNIRDKARAIEVYAAQALNTEAERQACEIRLRAERRAGQLLRQREMAKGGRPTENRSDEARGLADAKPLADLGISYQQSSDWQKMAVIPDDDFEAALAVAGPKPTTTGVIAAHAEPKASPVDPHALWLWGRLKDFDRDGLLDEDPNDLIATMLPHMRETTRHYAPLVAAWLERITP